MNVKDSGRETLKRFWLEAYRRELKRAIADSLEIAVNWVRTAIALIPKAPSDRLLHL